MRKQKKMKMKKIKKRSNNNKKNNRKKRKKKRKKKKEKVKKEEKEKVKEEEKEEKKKSIEEITKNYVFTADNFIKMVLILLRIRANIPVIMMGETGCGKTSLIKKLSELLNNGSKKKNENIKYSCWNN